MNRTRTVLGEYLLTGELVTDTALAIGSGEAGPDTDMACVRDGQGRLIIPGSALAGAIRAPFGTHAHWGGENLASLLYVEDAPAIGRVSVEARDGVGINRTSGTAAPTVLYAREVVPPGTRFRLELRVEAVKGATDLPALPKDKARAWILAIANDLAAGRALGSATSTGLGQVKLVPAGTSLTWRGLANRDELLAVLTGRNAPEKIKTSGVARPTILRVSVPWRPVSPLLVSVPMNGLVDRLPQTTGAGKHTRLVIPGASIKGALRTRAERIVRTLAGGPTPTKFADQLAEDLGPVARLYGRPPTRTGQTRTKGHRGAITVGEVYSPEIPQWDEVLRALAVRVQTSPNASAAEKQAEKAKPRAGANVLLAGTDLRINNHVAISRWTGGADDGKLFATLAPGAWFGDRGRVYDDSDCWDRLTLDVDLSRLGDSPDQVLCAIRLLMFVLRDLAEGWIGLGHGTTRGYGEITADPAGITFAFPALLPEPLADLAGRSLSLSALTGDEGIATARAALTRAWQDEIRELRASAATTEEVTA